MNPTIDDQSVPQDGETKTLSLEDLIELGLEPPEEK
jgi:hypothetical protein